jgi:hypothetical protein
VSNVKVLVCECFSVNRFATGSVKVREVASAGKFSSDSYQKENGCKINLPSKNFDINAMKGV